MDRTGLITRIFNSEHAIYQGRVWLTIDGTEQAGRISYSDGLDLAISSFKSVQELAASDLELLLLAEYTFLTQELNHCDKLDTQTISSLTQAIQSFDDAFLALQAVEKGTPYEIADMTFPHSAKYRIKDMPKDAFHIACISHRTRIGNSLRTPGLNMVEKALLKQRVANLITAQNAYLKKQKDILSKSK